MSTQLEIINFALDHLDEEYAIDENENRPAVLLLTRNFAQTRKSLLRRHPWNFAITDAKLETPTARDYGWDYEYDLPALCLRLLPLRADENHEGYIQKYELRGRKILTNEGENIHIRYVQDITDAEDLTDPLFVDALALSLALRAAHAITRKNSYVERIEAMFRMVMDQAQLIDSLEGTPEDANGDYWDNARHGGTY